MLNSSRIRNVLIRGQLTPFDYDKFGHIAPWECDLSIEYPDPTEGLPTLEDLDGTTDIKAPGRHIGRPRKNPYATQEQIRQFGVAERRVERQRLNQARQHRKNETEDFLGQVLEMNPAIEAMLVGLVDHIYQFAADGGEPLTDYDASTFAAQLLTRKVKELVSPKNVEAWKERQKKAEMAARSTPAATEASPSAPAPVPVAAPSHQTAAQEPPPQESPESPSESMSEEEDMAALMEMGLPGDDGDSNEYQSMADAPPMDRSNERPMGEYPSDWTLG